MTLSDIVGQDRVVSALRAAIAHGRLAHAYLFAGPDGVGKETTAFALAQALLCHDGPAADGCGRCAACRKVAARVHPDVALLAAEGEILPVDRVRELTARLQLTPFEGRIKIAIVREAHRMNAAAQNALLKTLEEPPGSALLVLATDAPHLLLPTVRSRCQLQAFAPLPDAFVRARLAAATGRAEDDPDVALAVALGEGSLGRALRIASEGLYGQRRELVEAVQALASPAAALDLAETWGADRARAVEALEILQFWYRDRALEAAGDERPPCLPDLPARAPVPAAVALRALDRLHEARAGLLSNANAQLTLERTFLSLAAGWRASEPRE